MENVVPSFIPGIYTNGDRDPADTGDIQVISYCVRGDATCGVGNPIANPVSTIFYLLPGFYVHGFLNDDINDYDETAEWTVGNTTYVVLDGGNPWGMMLRDLGLPVPTEFDTALSTVVPVPMPGQQATVAGQPVPTPRELQERIYQRHGWNVPVTDPDVVDKQDDRSTAQSTGGRTESHRVARPRRQRSNPPIPRPTNPSTRTRMRRARSRRRPRIRPLEPVATTPTPHQRRMAKLQETQIRRPPGPLPRTTRHRRGRNIARQRR